MQKYPDNDYLKQGCKTNTMKEMCKDNSPFKMEFNMGTFLELRD